MMSRYDPFRQALSLRRAMDQLFEQSFVNPGYMGGQQTGFAPMNVSETEQAYQVQVSLPGVKPEDIEMTLHNNTLTIRGHYHSTLERGQEPESQDVNVGAAGTTNAATTNQDQPGNQNQTSGQRQQRNYLMREISSGAFERTITFARPIEAEQVETSYENGILTVTLPVSASSRPRRINVSGRSSQTQIPPVQSSQSPQSTQANGGSVTTPTDPTNTSV